MKIYIDKERNEMVAMWLGILSSGIVPSPRKPGLNFYHLIWLYYAAIGSKTESR